jgi:D-alanyl-D-alanine carboxypeptidase/D-alanyl-D-alanine-endopeptidase (penicillin-binding protein 4)
MKLACAALLLAGALLVPAPRAAAGPLEDALKAPALRGARVGALVLRARDGAVLFARDANRPLVPASNMKLLTALASLATFGPSHRFHTLVYAMPGLDAAGRAEKLGVVGGGDPALTSEDWWRMAAELRRAGLRRVGRIVLDDGLFDRERWHPSWGAPTQRAYFAPISALQANYGAFTVEVRAGSEPGAPVRASVDPPVAYLPLVLRATTAARGAPSTIAVRRLSADGQEPIVIDGAIAAGAAPQVFRLSVADGTRYAGSVLALALAANGIVVEGDATQGRVERARAPLLRFEGRTMAEITTLLLKYSSNPIAEGLAKALAVESSAPGSFAAGAASTRARLAALGLDLSGLELVDASGLSPRDRVSPRLLADVLRIARASFAFGPELLAALPIAGLDGTLRERTNGAQGRVRAKTGRIERVAALSGLAQARDGEELVFSLIVNGYRSDDEAAVRAVDAFAEALVQIDGRAAGR